MATTDNNMGIGSLAETAFKRKYRWMFNVENIGGDAAFKIPGSYVKSGNRPQIDIDETEINYLNGKTFIPGKATFNEISFTYYDVIMQGDPTIPNLFRWLNRVYNVTEYTAPLVTPGATGNPQIKATQGSYPFNGKGYAGIGVLTLLDGCGYAVEQWDLMYCWPKSINFGDLDYSSSDECNIELTLRYAYAKYQSFCAKGIVDPNCTAICPGGKGVTRA